MDIQSVNPETLDALVHQHPLVIVDFWADWCAPCKQFASVYAAVAEQYPDVLFAKVDIAQYPDLAEMFEIRSIPHLMIFKAGTIIYSEAGSMPQTHLQNLIDQAQQVAM